jgi:hypothetical protein
MHKHNGKYPGNLLLFSVVRKALFKKFMINILIFLLTLGLI